MEDLLHELMLMKASGWKDSIETLNGDQLNRLQRTATSNAIKAVLLALVLHKDNQDKFGASSKAESMGKVIAALVENPEVVTDTILEIL